MTLIENVLLPGTLWLIMYSMGLSLTLGDFRRVFANARALAVGSASILVVVPIVGSVAAFFWGPTPELAVGLVLLATCPGGMLSNLMTDLAEGDLALSLSLTVLVSLIYLLVVPIYAYVAVRYFLGTDEVVSIPFLQSVWKILSITLIPVGLGLLTRSIVPRLAQGLKAYVKYSATLVLVVVFVIIMADQMEVLRANAGRLLVIIIGMNLFAFCWSFFLSRIMALERAERTAVCIEHLIRQEGTAMFIAVSLLGSGEMSLPMIINTPVGLTLCTLLVISLRSFGGRFQVNGMKS